MPLPALLGGLARIGGGRALSRAASRGASKVGKDPARRAAASKRLKRMNRKKLGRDFLKGALDSQGFNTEGMARNQRSGTGGLLRSLGYNPASEDFDFNRPAFDTPERESPVSNPTISSLDSQLKKIAKTAADLGVISKKQQEQLLKEALKTETASKEQQLEEPDATPLSAEGPGAGIGPADSAVEKLLESIAGLQQTIDDKVKEAQANTGGNLFMEGMLDSLGLGGVKKARAAKRAAPQLRKGFREVKGGGYQNIKTGQMAKADDALKNFKTVDPKHLTKAAKARQATAVLTKRPGIVATLGGAIAGTASKAKQAIAVGAGAVSAGAKQAITAGAGAIGAKATKAKQAIAVGAGKSSSKVAGALGGAIAKTKAGAGTATKIGKDAIAKIAKPLVAKSLVKTGIKSIPIVGAVAGGMFALGRLLKGDVVGAGLDAASGLGGPLTAIPALVLSLARDVYMSAFGIAPETDPQAGPRMAMVKGTVEDLAKEALGQKVTKPGAAPGAAPTSQAKAPAIPSVPTAAPGGQAKVSAPSPSSTPLPPSKGGEDAGGSAGPAPTEKKASAAAKGASASGAGGAVAASTPQKVAEQQAGKKLEGEEAAPPSAAAGAPEVKSLTGEKILQASTEAPPSAAGMGMTGSSPPQPATSPTTKGRAKGMGDVPEPTYVNLGSIAKQLYFGSVAGVMAA